MEIITKNLLERAIEHLSKDTVLGEVIENNPLCHLHTNRIDLFTCLCKIIIFQQLSKKAASSIFNRLLLFFEGNPINPDQILTFNKSDLKAIGISSKKIQYIRSIALEATSKNLDLNSFYLMDDQYVIEKLINYKGIGTWSAEMFLIFGLRRPDVFSLKDAGLRKAIKLLYALDDLNNNLILKISSKWRPYRSIASWYLWHSIDNL